MLYYLCKTGHDLSIQCCTINVEKTGHDLSIQCCIINVVKKQDTIYLCNAVLSM